MDKTIRHIVDIIGDLSEIVIGLKVCVKDLFDRIEALERK